MYAELSAEGRGQQKTGEAEAPPVWKLICLKRSSAVLLSLRLTARQLLDPGLVAAAWGRALSLRSGFLARCALYLLTLVFIGNAFGICHVVVRIFFPEILPAARAAYAFCCFYNRSSWANFSTSFLVPYPLNCTVIFASSPSPSRARRMPSPYLGCRTRTPLPSQVRPVGAGMSIFGRAG